MIVALICPLPPSSQVLHRIPTLSNYFLYFNNDVLLRAPTPLSTFVRAGRYFRFVDWEIAPIPDEAACAFRFACLRHLSVYLSWSSDLLLCDANVHCKFRILIVLLNVAMISLHRIVFIVSCSLLSSNSSRLYCNSLCVTLFRCLLVRARIPLSQRRCVVERARVPRQRVSHVARLLLGSHRQVPHVLCQSIESASITTTETFA